MDSPLSHFKVLTKGFQEMLYMLSVTLYADWLLEISAKRAHP